MIYFIQESGRGLIKIGSAVDPSMRLVDLQIGSPFSLVLLLALEGGRDEEKALHRRFSRLRYRGEWFKPKSDLLRFMLDCARSGKTNISPATAMQSVSGYTAMILHEVESSEATVTSQSICAKLSISIETARKLLSRLVSRGMIRRSQPGLFERIQKDGERQEEES